MVFRVSALSPHVLVFLFGLIVVLPVLPRPVAAGVDSALEKILALQKELDAGYAAAIVSWRTVRSRIKDAAKVPDDVSRIDLDLDVIRSGLVECFNAPEEATVQCGGGPAYRALIALKSRASEQVARLIDERIAFLDQLRVDFLAARRGSVSLLETAAHDRAGIDSLVSAGKAEAIEIEENPLESAAAKDAARYVLRQLAEQTVLLEKMASRVETEIGRQLQEIDEAKLRVVRALERYADFLGHDDTHDSSAQL